MTTRTEFLAWSVAVVTAGWISGCGKSDTGVANPADYGDLPEPSPSEQQQAVVKAEHAQTAMEQAMTRIYDANEIQLEDIDFSQADQLYREAIAADPRNTEAQFGAALTSLLVLSTDSNLQAAQDTMNAYLGGDGEYEGKITVGMMSLTRAASAVKRLPLMAGKMAVAALGDPVKVSDLQQTIEDEIIPAIDYSLARLQIVEGDPSFTFTLTPAMLGDEYEEPREVDLGEAYVLDGQLRLFKAILEVAVAYNLDFDDHGAYDFLDDDTNASLLRQLVRLDKEDADFMTLRPGNRMAQAKDLLLEAIGKLEAGLAAIRAENDDQHDDVIKKAHLTDLDEEVDLSSEDVPAFFRDMKTAEDALAKLREALEGTVAIEADYDGDEDTPDATLVFDLGRFFDQPVRDLRTLFPYHEWHPELLENRDFTDELVLTDARGAPLGASPPLVFPNPSANGILSNIQSSGQLLGLLGVTADNLNDRDLLYETGLVYSRDGGIVVTNSSSFDIEVVYSGEVGGEWIEGQSVSVRAGSPAVDAVRTSSGAPLRGDGYYTLVVTRASDGRVLYDSSRDYGYGMVAAPRPADQHRRLPKAAQISVGWWGRWVNGNIYVTVADEELVVETADRYWDDPANPYVATRVAISQSVTGDNHGLAGTPITAANIQQVVATVMQGIGQAMAKGPGTHNGANSGTVRIALSTGKPTQTIMYSCTFDDYSDDGQIFLNGTVRINMSGTTYSHTFDVDVTGAYAGAIEGEINMANGVYSGYWDIDGTRITF